MLPPSVEISTVDLPKKPTMDSTKSQEKTNTHRRAGPQEIFPTLPVHPPERSPPLLGQDCSERSHPRPHHPRHPVDCLAHHCRNCRKVSPSTSKKKSTKTCEDLPLPKEDSGPHFPTGTRCDCPRCLKKYGGCNQNDARLNSGELDQGSLDHSPAPL